MALAVRGGVRSTFICTACGASSPRWAGRCPDCAEWNTLDERVVRAGASALASSAATPLQLLAGTPDAPARLGSGFAEVDRVLGGGMVAGSVVLLGGDPGVGKSTLALQVAARTGGGDSPALYCSGEESASQLGLRARRLRCAGAGVELLIETDLDVVAAAIDARRPSLAVVDSVQTLHDPSAAGTPGSPAQVRAAVARLVTTAKATGVPVVVVGHVTKEGAIAGPRTLEHMVDVVLYLEGDRLGDQRLLRGVKNRFGSTGELGLLSMQPQGMRDVDSPGRAFVEGATAGMPGSALTVTCDGVRPLVVEVQALTVRSAFGMPRRTAIGIDVNRLHLLVAVLERRAGIALGQADVFVNAVGGLEIDDPAADLGVALALAGSHSNRALAGSCMVAGELGLGGEVRRVTRVEARLAEAAALGLRQAVVPAAQPISAPAGVECIPVRTLRDAISLLR